MRYASHSVSTGTAQAPKLPPVKATIRHTVVRPAKKGKTPKAPHAPAPTDPNQSLIDAATNTRFGPQEQSYSQALGQNQSFTQGIPTWFANAMTEISGLQSQGQKNSADTLARVQAYNSQPATGTALDQQAATSRNNLNAQFATMLGRDAQSNSDYLDRMRAAYAAQQNNQLASAAQDRTKLLTGEAALKGQEGDYRTTYGSQLQAAEQKAAMDQANLAVKQGTLAYLTGNAQSLAKDRTAGQKVARSGVRIKKTAQKQTANQNAVKNALSVNKLALDAQKERDRLLGKGKGSNKGNGKYTGAKLNKYDDMWRGAIALAGHLKAAKTYVPKSGPDKGKTLPVTRDVVYSALLKQYPNDPEYAAAAANVIFGKPVEGHDRHVLSTKGVHPAGMAPTGADALKGFLRLVTKKGK